MILPRFYQIIDEAKLLEQFLPLGLKLVQLRIKDKPIRQVRDQIKTAKKWCDQAQCQLVINDYWKIAIDEGCDMIHLGQEDLASAELSTIKQNGLKLGLSTHNHAELQVAIKAQPDYIALGPIYHTLLKAMKWQPQGLKKITLWKQHINTIPLVAIGGLNIKRAPEVYRAGADSICVVTDVLLNKNPEKRIQQWLKIANNNI